jgi:hypothetical protein
VTNLLERLRRLLEQPAEPHPGHWSDALTVAYQQGLAWLGRLREEADAVASSRRRLALGADLWPDEAARAEAAARDAALAAEQRELLAVRDALRVHLEELRAERERILALPDPDAAARRARVVLARWQVEPERLVRQVEPEGFIADADPPAGYEQPPGWEVP